MHRDEENLPGDGNEGMKIMAKACWLISMFSSVYVISFCSSLSSSHVRLSVFFTFFPRLFLRVCMCFILRGSSFSSGFLSVCFFFPCPLFAFPVLFSFRSVCVFRFLTLVVSVFPWFFVRFSCSSCACP